MPPSGNLPQILPIVHHELLPVVEIAYRAELFGRRLGVRRPRIGGGGGGGVCGGDVGFGSDWGNAIAWGRVRVLAREGGEAE